MKRVVWSVLAAVLVTCGVSAWVVLAGGSVNTTIFAAIAAAAAGTITGAIAIAIAVAIAAVAAAIATPDAVAWWKVAGVYILAEGIIFAFFLWGLLFLARPARVSRRAFALRWRPGRAGSNYFTLCAARLGACFFVLKTPDFAPEVLFGESSFLIFS